MIIPKQFQVHHPLKYPVHSSIDFERWFLENFYPRKSTARTYLPILWTAYYCTHKYGNDPLAIERLQKFISELPKIPYYTICQYDDGILNDLSGHDIFVFSMSGRPMDYPLPLVAQPLPYRPAVTKDIFCNFIGRNTHPIRKELFNITSSRFYISQKNHKPVQFADILNRSIFTLCPRGYGPTSFRIQEALQFNSIPVYISDKFIIPHALPFSEYGVLIRPDQVKDLPKILKDVDTSKFTNPYKTHFTYESVQRSIFAALAK